MTSISRPIFTHKRFRCVLQVSGTLMFGFPVVAWVVIRPHIIRYSSTHYNNRFLLELYEKYLWRLGRTQLIANLGAKCCIRWDFILQNLNLFSIFKLKSISVIDAGMSVIKSRETPLLCFTLTTLLGSNILARSKRFKLFSYDCKLANREPDQNY